MNAGRSKATEGGPSRGAAEQHRASGDERSAAGTPLSTAREEHLTPDAAGGLYWQPTAETLSPPQLGELQMERLQGDTRERLRERALLPSQAR